MTFGRSWGGLQNDIWASWSGLRNDIWASWGGYGMTFGRVGVSTE